jgi:hypothetical protein
MGESFWGRQGRELMLLKTDPSCFYAIQHISLVIEFDENGHVNLISIFPSVIAFRLALPFDQVLQGLSMSPPLVSTDLFHLVFFFPIN